MLLGFSAFSARLPMALAVVGLVLTTFSIGNLFSGRRAGFYSGLVLLTIPALFLFTRIILGDAIFVLFMALAFRMFLGAYLLLSMRENSSESARGKAFGAMMGFYVFLALAVMTKGLIGLVFPFLIIGIFLAISHDLSFIKKMHLGLGTVVFLALAAPWHIAVGMRNPGFYYNYFVNEHILRALNRHWPPDFLSIPLWRYWMAQIVGLFPWLMFAPMVIKYWPSNYRVMNRDEKLLLFAAIWMGTVFLFFSISGRLEYYAMPAYPGFALMVGLALARASEQRTADDLAPAASATLTVGSLVIVGVMMILASQTGPHASAAALNPHTRNAFFLRSTTSRRR